MKKYPDEDSPWFLASVLNNIIINAAGEWHDRELGFSDRPTICAAVETMKRNQYSLRALVLTIATSELFTTK